VGVINIHSKHKLSPEAVDECCNYSDANRCPWLNYITTSCNGN